MTDAELEMFAKDAGMTLTGFRDHLARHGISHELTEAERRHSQKRMAFLLGMDRPAGASRQEPQRERLSRRQRRRLGREGAGL